MTDSEGVPGIAIVGMAGRFPGASDVDALWANLCAGVESVRPLEEAELRAVGIDSSAPGFVNAVAVPADIEAFDAAFFGMTRREAELTDPQHRLLLETVWTALAHAGHRPADSSVRIGLFGGVAENYYHRYNLLAHPELLARSGFYPVRLASGREYAITKAAYKIGLTGPAIAVMTACSTSAVATHLAAQSLLAGDCDLALAGGAHLFLPGRYGYTYQEDGILSPDGHVRAFDAEARGTVMGSGVAVIALKRLADALADGDTIYALVRGTAVNNDGAAKVGFTAPSLEGQHAVIADALAVADVGAETVGFVEAHGTGTSLGDPIEVAALTEAFRRHTDRTGYCAIGTLKSNIGHLDAAAGVAGIIKAALSLYHERIPPSINFTAPNPQIDFESSPFFVNTELLEWPRSEQPRRAGVSSFGFGGTNAHVVLQEPPRPMPVSAAWSAPRILTLSAKSAEALERRHELLAVHLGAHPEDDLADVAHTLAVGRERMPYRSAVVASDAATAVALLQRPPAEAAVSRTSAAAGAEVAFLLTGQGAQYLGMGQGLYASEPVFAAAIDECESMVGDIAGHGLVELLFGGREEADAAAVRILHTDVGQPAILALQVALARLWESWGVRPAALVGHSVGEIAAAHLGGVLSLEDALGLAVVRGRLMADLPRGAMTAVLAEEATLTPLLDEEVSLAAVNAAEQCVVSGPPAAIEALEARLTTADIACRRLPTDRAFHSSMIDPVLAQLRDHVEGLRRGAMTIPMVSTLTGAWVSPGDLAQPLYWSDHARRTVRFRDAVGVLLAERDDLVLIEIGPGETLASLTRQHEASTPRTAVISTLSRRGDGDDAVHARRALADAWTAGVDVDWASVNGSPRRRLPLPTYPFARERFWVESPWRPALVVPADDDLPEPMPAAPTAPDERLADGGSLSPEDGQPATRRERIAAQITAILVDLSGTAADELDPATSFTELGFDSLFLTQANSQFRRAFGVRLTLGQLLGEAPSVNALAAHVEAVMEQGHEQQAVSSVDAGPSPSADGSLGVPVLPNVTRFMVERGSPPTGQWNLGVMLIPTRHLEADVVREVVADLIARHDALRLRFSGDGSGTASRIAPVGGPVPFGRTDLRDIDPAGRSAAVERRASEVQESLDLEHGPLLHVELFDLADDQRLLVVAHHFVVDPLSWPSFWRDFESLLALREHGEPPRLPPPPMSFETWARALQQWADTDALGSDVELWRRLPWKRVRPIPLDHPDGINSNGSAQHVELVLSREETVAMLRQTPRVPRKADLLVSALASVLSDWTGSDTVLIDMMGHGRDDDMFEGFDPMETVGFFNSYTPFVLRLPVAGAGAPILSDQTEPLIQRGLGFDLLRYMTNQRKVRRSFQRLPRAQVLFNHHGQRDDPSEVPHGSLFKVAPESIGDTHDAASARYYPLAISSMIRHGQLRLRFVYSTNLHERSTIEWVASEFHRRLSEVVGGAGGVTGAAR